MTAAVNKGADVSGQSGPMAFELRLNAEQVSALYLTLYNGRQRPAYGWIEQPLQDIEKALMPLHGAIYDRQFNAMNRSFFGDDRMRLEEAPLSTVADAAAIAAAQRGAE